MLDDLTIVMPAFNEERRLPLALDRALAWRTARAGELRRIDVLVVDDGSDDATGELVRRHFAGSVRLVTRPERGGKGAAVRTGVEAVRTRWLCFTDADASIPFEEFDVLLAHAERAPVVIGSKRAPGSQLCYPLSRRLLGALGQRLISLCVVSGFYDTQCGFKLMRTDVTRELFRAGTIDGFGFELRALPVPGEAPGAPRDRGADPLRAPARRLDQGVHLSRRAGRARPRVQQPRARRLSEPLRGSGTPRAERYGREPSARTAADRERRRPRHVGRDQPRRSSRATTTGS